MAHHVTIGSKRTTFSLDATVAEFLALHLGAEPDTRAAHRAICRWAQAELDRNGDPHQTRVSQWLRSQAVAVLVRADLAKAHADWMDRKISKQGAIPASVMTTARLVS